MKVYDLSTRHIGQTIRVEASHIRIEGLFESITVTSRTESDEMIFPPPPPETHITHLALKVAGHELQFHGNEEVTIIEDGDQ